MKTHIQTILVIGAFYGLYWLATNYEQFILKILGIIISLIVFAVFYFVIYAMIKGDKMN